MWTEEERRGAERRGAERRGLITECMTYYNAIVDAQSVLFDIFFLIYGIVFVNGLGFFF